VPGVEGRGILKLESPGISKPKLQQGRLDALSLRFRSNLRSCNFGFEIPGLSNFKFLSPKSESGRARIMEHGYQRAGFSFLTREQSWRLQKLTLRKVLRWQTVLVKQGDG